MPETTPTDTKTDPVLPKGTIGPGDVEVSRVTIDKTATSYIISLDPDLVEWANTSGLQIDLKSRISYDNGLKWELRTTSFTSKSMSRKGSLPSKGFPIVNSKGQRLTHVEATLTLSKQCQMGLKADTVT